MEFPSGYATIPERIVFQVANSNNCFWEVSLAMFCNLSVIQYEIISDYLL